MPSGGPKVAGHTATLVGSEMYVIGGYDRISGFSERSYVYNIDTKEWKNLTTSGPSPKGVYFTEINTIYGSLLCRRKIAHFICSLYQLYCLLQMISCEFGFGSCCKTLIVHNGEGNSVFLLKFLKRCKRVRL